MVKHTGPRSLTGILSRANDLYKLCILTKSKAELSFGPRTSNGSAARSGISDATALRVCLLSQWACGASAPRYLLKADTRYDLASREGLWAACLLSRSLQDAHSTALGEKRSLQTWYGTGESTASLGTASGFVLKPWTSVGAQQCSYTVCKFTHLLLHSSCCLRSRRRPRRVLRLDIGFESAHLLLWTSWRAQRAKRLRWRGLLVHLLAVYRCRVPAAVQYISHCRTGLLHRIAEKLRIAAENAALCNNGLFMAGMYRARLLHLAILRLLGALLRLALRGREHPIAYYWVFNHSGHACQRGLLK